MIGDPFCNIQASALSLNIYPVNGTSGVLLWLKTILWFYLNSEQISYAQIPIMT